jgi:nitrite reductase/ring-hydroxylating ferredoxin subunit
VIGAIGMENAASETSGMWQCVASLADLEPEYPKHVKVDKRDIALYIIDGAVFATEDICSHAYARLSDGYVDGFQVFCPLHGGSFDVRTGAPMTAPCMEPIAVFECRIEGDSVLVRMGADNLTPGSA